MGPEFQALEENLAMANIRGVEAYVLKTAGQFKSRMKETRHYLEMNLPPPTARRANELLLICTALARDLGSMSRLLGDLRMDEENARRGSSEPPGRKISG